jgi:hypothetical protein
VFVVLPGSGQEKSPPAPFEIPEKFLRELEFLLAEAGTAIR